MDLLETMARRNPALVRTAALVHRERLVPPDTYVADLDAIRANAAALRAALGRHGLVSYYEAKQLARNPLVCTALVEAGFEAAIAIDVEEAAALHENGFRVGHVGHLGQPASAEIGYVVAELAPEVVTVYSLERAAELGAAAAAAGRTQDVLLRVLGRDDLRRDLVTGGTPEAELVATARRLAGTEGVRLVGATTYPALRWDIRGRRWTPTPNLGTLIRAGETLRAEGFEVTQLNAAGNTCVSSAALLAESGATHVEPGHAFVGSTPGHFFDDLEEIPALAWVSEVAYTLGDAAYAFASGLVANHTIGFWNSVVYERLLAFCGPDPDTIQERRLWADPPEFSHSDPSSYMYARIHQGRAGARVGDTVVLGVRTQVYRSNSARLAVVEGIRSGSPRLLGLYDRNGRPAAAPGLASSASAAIGTPPPGATA
jgi:predicted amino acid racemase